MRALLFLILLYPLAEIVALFAMFHHFGALATFAFLAASALFGVFLLRNQKLAMLFSLGALLQQGNGTVAIYPLLWPLRTLIAGVLFMLPGPISDVIGLLLLLPFRGPTLQTPRPVQPDNVIDGDFTSVDEPVERNRHLH